MMQRLRSIGRIRNDGLALLTLLLLWLLFFWRILTPVAADQASFVYGDFARQFVAFGGYQYERMAEGEIPLWNPYNNGGLPFIADTQAAVFYPPRLLTMGLSVAAGEWSYNALQLEAAFHVLLLTLLMYVFVRRLTLDAAHGVAGALIAALIAGYGGFTSGYPPLQTALLEAFIWFPLAALGILEATRHKALCWGWLLLAGWALGLSWLAGHPQTSYLLTWALVAWLVFRIWQQKIGWRRFITALLLFGGVTFGVTAVTFLPGVEYLALASRGDLGFKAKSGGFALHELLQILSPGAVSRWSPLYVGIPALVLAYVAARLRWMQSVFWLGLGLIALLLSLGENTALYHLLYNTLPGLSYFRGQERAAMLVAHSAAILAGIGAAYAFAGPVPVWLRRGAYALFGLTGLLLFAALISANDLLAAAPNPAIFSLLVVLALALLLRLGLPQNARVLLLVVLVAFELLSVNSDADSNYADVPASEQLSTTAPPLVQTVLDQADEQPFRVDGFRGLRANYGSLYGVMDIRGISPLFLSSANTLINADYWGNYLAWELFAVKYAFSERESFTIPTSVLAVGQDREGPIYLHQLDDPRPFAHLVYDYALVDSDAFAYALLNDPRFDARNNVIVQREPRLTLPDAAPEDHAARVTSFAPEALSIDVETPENALLSVALLDYPGWRATLDAEPAEILRAYGALSAIEIPAGEHIVRFVYDPLSYRIGAGISALTWGLLLVALIFGGFQRWRKRA